MQQLKLVFELEKPELPKELDRLLVSFIKAAAESSSQEFFHEMYAKDRSVLKQYTYSYMLDSPRFEADRILLGSSRFTMFFSDSDLGEFIRFFNGFKSLVRKRYPMKNNSMTLVSIVTQRYRDISDREVVVKMMNPLIVRRHDPENNKDMYYTFDHREFSEALKENIDFFLHKTGKSVSTEGFSITPVKAKKVVVPVFGRNTDASLGVYKLTGTSELLNVLYQAGMGARRSSGHGKWTLLL